MSRAGWKSVRRVDIIEISLIGCRSVRISLKHSGTARNETNAIAAERAERERSSKRVPAQSAPAIRQHYLVKYYLLNLPNSII